MKSALIFTAIICLFTTCNSNSNSNSNSKKAENTEISTTPRIVTLHDSTDLYTITASYPEIKQDTTNAIGQFIYYVVNHQKEEWKEGGSVYNAEMALKSEFPERANIRYEFTINNTEIKSDKYKTTSYLFNTYIFEGGANGTNTVNSFVFNKNWKKLEITDVLNIDNNNDIAISRLLAEKALKKHPDIDKTILYEGLGLSYLKSDGITLDNSKCNCDGYFFGSNFQNFVIKDSSISFFFNKAQIAPATFGIVEIELSMNELKPYLVSEFEEDVSENI